MPKKLHEGLPRKDSCLYCGNVIYLCITRDLWRKQFCSRSCRTKWQHEHNHIMGMKDKSHTDQTKRKIASYDKSGPNNPSWKGGRLVGKYIKLWTKDGHRLEHVLKAEKALGRRLKKGEVVHHINGDKHDNRNDNLIVCTRSYHQWLHKRMSFLYQQEHFGDIGAA